MLIAPPLLRTVQLTVSFCSAYAVQRMLMFGGSTVTVTLVEPLLLSAELRTVSEMVLLPDELKLVRYDELLPEPPSLSVHE